jgi:hypothetical protein
MSFDKWKKRFIYQAKFVRIYVIIQRRRFSSLLVFSSILWWCELQSLKWIFWFENYWIKFNLLVITSFLHIVRECAERFHWTFSRSKRAAAQNEWDSSSSNRTSSFFLHSDFDHRISWSSSLQIVRTMRLKSINDKTHNKIA